MSDLMRNPIRGGSFAADRRWRRALPLLAAAFVPIAAWPTSSASPGCGKQPPASGIHQLDHAGVTRMYALSLPAGYDAKRPSRLLLVFHGWGGDESEFLSVPTVTEESGRRGYLRRLVPRS